MYNYHMLPLKSRRYRYSLLSNSKSLNYHILLLFLYDTHILPIVYMLYHAMYNYHMLPLKNKRYHYS